MSGAGSARESLLRWGTRGREFPYNRLLRGQVLIAPKLSLPSFRRSSRFNGSRIYIGMLLLQLFQGQRCGGTMGKANFSPAYRSVAMRTSRGTASGLEARLARIEPNPGVTDDSRIHEDPLWSRNELLMARCAQPPHETLSPEHDKLISACQESPTSLLPVCSEPP